uniref:Palmitoyltransferase n=1 Tax=Rhabditophanes sp. KR3021 TaxID=114890 RepID=A0AC35UAZ2_9BILA
MNMSNLNRKLRLSNFIDENYLIKRNFDPSELVLKDISKLGNDECSICFESPIDPVGCIYCKKMLGCKECLSKWYWSSEKTCGNAWFPKNCKNMNQSKTCLLCRAPLKSLADFSYYVNIPKPVKVNESATKTILHNYICACYYGPGYLPMEWTPPKEVDPSNFQYCVKCKGYKAPRAHHCSQCNRCIMKMDHHCPYINTCVGHANHKFFLMFMIYVILGCSYSCVISSVILYDAFCVLGDRNLLYSSKYDYIAYEVILTALIDCVFSAAVTAAVGVLFAVQMKGILRNKTQLEEFICEKLKIEFEKMEDFPYPYDLGKWENLKQIFCHGNTPKGNGIWWDTTEETNNLTLGLYQRELKNIVEGIKSITEDDVVKFGSSLSNAIQSAMNSNDSVKDVASKLKAENSDFLKKINTVGEAVNATQAKLVAIYDKLSPNVKTWFTQLCSVLEQMKNESSTAEQEQLQLLKGVLTTYSTFTQTDLDSIKSVSESAHTIATNPELKAQIQSFINNPTSETAKLIGEQLNNAVVDIFTKAP